MSIYEKHYHEGRLAHIYIRLVRSTCCGYPTRMLQSSAFHLDYYRVSPVRGQLEPYDPTTARNWRYIQTTDTPNELKVLLPPSVASTYEQLLRLEVMELDKRVTVSWERILEIRHLKDRMIRKCQRLSRVLPPKRIGRGDPFVFQTLIAPEDFRLKEMETWFHQEQLRHKGRSVAVHRPTVQKAPSRNSCCVRCARATQPDLAASAPSTAPAPKLDKARSSQLKEVEPKSLKNTPTSSRAISPVTEPVKTESSHIPPPVEVPPPSVPEDVNFEAPDTKLVDPEVVQADAAPTPGASPPPADAEEQNDSSESSTIAPTPPASPPPLPHLLRISDPSLVKDILEAETSAVIRPMPEPPVSRPPLVRRRSCIKRSSVGESVKTVSWADDREWTEHFPKRPVTPEPAIVEEPSSTWGENYDEHVSRLDMLHRELTKSLEEIRADPVHFRVVDAIISDHKQRVTANCYVGQLETLLDQVREEEDDDEDDDDWDGDNDT
ncbi:uncharacterized protein EV420DRAFT_936488 [Desarmillaria tabescens]|uniref:Uncharacterized protein n=1 Tax=Armillaria tabescens TaxID=1929756 RepID=A0AA39NG84_ARMTA|nr:uncharacterized protein EV420DRAFT_936488 [Desarmillaria tabescens]KAK0465066.1 hypothetical protein EV420DRAFT_936488 [Desarmillaria tabescens]